jgi:Trk K+ transport system NAD-binding subunit
MKPLIIVCGLNRFGYKILCLLRQQDALVVGISDRPIAYENHENDRKNLDSNIISQGDVFN